ADYSQLIEQHPTFIPAYWGRAEAYSLLKNEKAAFKDRMTAKNIEDNKGKYHEKKEKTQVKTNETKNYTQEFNLSVAQGLHKNTEKTVYKNEYRGTIQDKYFDIIPENNFYVSYFSAEPDVRKRIYDHSLLDKLPNLKLCNSDLSLAENQVEQLFSVIHTNNEQIQAEPSAAKLYYFRGIAYSLLQDFDSALNDFNAAVKLDPNFTLAYFSRAVIRYKNMLVNRNECELNAGDSQKPVSEKDEVTLIIADYQKAIELQKDFYFAWFNLGNTYLQAKDFKQAIQCYHISIQYSPDFAEAYFNRGLTYVFIGENKKGITDLSKSGELGIYQSYNFIKRFNK
ncbi:MAG: tetratricopeptide repeat protein, partial [Bacteroidales bacterium]|nr:tetratricopeptide repeat protein [Bacteroidales bacterium]